MSSASRAPWLLAVATFGLAACSDGVGDDTTSTAGALAGGQGQAGNGAGSPGAADGGGRHGGAPPQAELANEQRGEADYSRHQHDSGPTPHRA
jgi:hypothetical protein